jgi:tripartite-type tricarboxylate transporter receptor subunit TctC
MSLRLWRGRLSKDLLSVTLLVAMHPSVPVNSVQELAAYAKKNPGKLSWAGVGSHGPLLRSL